MSATDEKHMDVARELALSSEGIIRPAEFEALARDIAAALSHAHAEGMKRAAEIAGRDVDWTRFGKKEVHVPWENGHDDARDYRVGIVAGRSIAAAILSELNHQSSVAQISPRQGDAGEVESSLASPATHSSERSE